MLTDDDPSQLLAQPSVDVSKLTDCLDIIFAQLIHGKMNGPCEVKTDRRAYPGTGAVATNS